MGKERLSSVFFKGNRQRLFAKLGTQVLVVTANGLLQKTADEAYDFKQDTNFWYLTGINEPDLILVITEHDEFIILPDFARKRRDANEPLDFTALAESSGLQQILSEHAGWSKIDAALKKGAKVATVFPPPTRIRFHGIYANPARRQLVNRLKRRYPKAELVDARPLLASLRTAKQPIELNLMKKALSITTETLKEVLSADKLTKFHTTKDVERAILSGFQSQGGQGHAFDPVISSGSKTVTIHYQNLDQPLKEGELLLCDVGCQYQFYNADITRTVCIGRPSKRQQAVFDAVKSVQSEAIKLIKPGMDYIAYEKEVMYLVGEQLIRLGLIKRASAKTIRPYFNTACSHSLGLDTHDPAAYRQPLPKNMVMTVEPGIYIRSEGIGVRLEDVVQITDNGCEVWSQDLASSLKL